MARQLWWLRVLPWWLIMSAYLSIVILLIIMGPSKELLTLWLPYMLTAWLLFIAVAMVLYAIKPQKAAHLAYVVLACLLQKGILLAHAETAFDCATTGIKLATYDLLNTAPCPEYKSLYRKKVMRKAQFLQRDASKLIDAVQCQLHVSRELCYCGSVWSSKYDFRSPSLPFLSERRGNAVPQRAPQSTLFLTAATPCIQAAKCVKAAAQHFRPVVVPTISLNGVPKSAPACRLLHVAPAHASKQSYCRLPQHPTPPRPHITGCLASSLGAWEVRFAGISAV